MYNIDECLEAVGNSEGAWRPELTAWPGPELNGEFVQGRCILHPPSQTLLDKQRAGETLKAFRQSKDIIQFVHQMEEN